MYNKKSSASTIPPMVECDGKIELQLFLSGPFTADACRAYSFQKASSLAVKRCQYSLLGPVPIVGHNSFVGLLSVRPISPTQMAFNFGCCMPPPLYPRIREA